MPPVRSFPPPASSDAPPASSDAPPPLIRRREKRRHVSSASVDMRDPLEILSLAIRLDEATGDSDILKEPLEHGRLYPHSQDTFLKAMAYLEQHTKPRRARRQLVKNWSGSRRPALTPIILSGLIAGQLALQKEHHPTTQVASTTNPDHALPSPSEMVLFCNTMRRQALLRIKSGHRRTYIRTIVVIGSLVGMVVVSHYQAMFRIQAALIQLGYVALDQSPGTYAPNDYTHRDKTSLEDIPLQPCETFETYEDVCRIAETRLWAFTKDYALPASSQYRQCKYDRCSAESRSMIRHQLSQLPGRADEFKYGHAPYTMHTVAVQEATILDGKRLDEKQRHMRHPEVGWLGDSLVNYRIKVFIDGVIDKQLDNAKNKDDFTLRVLDLGCGIGGLLYALLPFERDGKIQFQQLDYTGISLAPAEIRTARLLRDEHRINARNARFLQMSFDDPRLSTMGPYDVIVATETLTYSKNLTITLENLVRSLHVDGSIIVNDDVVVNGPVQFPTNWSGSDLPDWLMTLTMDSGRHSMFVNYAWEEAFDERALRTLHESDWGLHDLLPLLEKNVTDEGFHLWHRVTHLGTRIARWAEHWEWWNPLLRTEVLLNQLQRWEDWKHGGAFSAGVTGKYRIKAMAAARTIQFIREDHRLTRADQLRKLAHERVNLTYNTYIWERSRGN